MDIISLICPKCGGSLQIKEFSSRAKCHFCNTEHVVHNDGSGAIELEYHARCPKCKRNDKVKSVTVIQREKTPLASLLSPPEEEIVINPPPILRKSEVLSKKKKTLIVVTSLLIFFYFIAASGFTNPESKHTPVSVIVLLGLLSLCTWGYVKWRSNYMSKMDAEFELLESRRNAAREWVDIENNTIQENWQNKIGIWKRLYYCNRDDCIFIPDMNTCAPPNDMNRYIDSILENDESIS